DLSDSRMNAKIREAQARKTPYMLVVGGNEQEAVSVSVRTRDGGQMNMMAVDGFTAFIAEKVASKAAL
ncbi:MAG: His/Gly/Thr/Pro-type tRNA ligase C-terminal domain-containing protein, partial [Spirochaetaceae bacterium]|nr:His/Gly/Thr/Pro-type tRNA ligase C-terminal domain-containing protein [Spirochaetaceae bacterium]